MNIKFFKYGIYFFDWILKFEIQEKIVIENQAYCFRKDNFRITILKLEKTKNEYRKIIKEIILFKYNL